MAKLVQTIHKSCSVIAHIRRRMVRGGAGKYPSIYP
ncbi:hypothetical protein ACNKHK_01690 [Shigella flexneri]